MSSPCLYCGVNSWTACKHRPAAEPIERPDIPDPKAILRQPRPGAGYNFKTRKRRQKAGSR